jgi:hypothetical protein
MAFSPADIQANREFFAAKLKAEKQIVEVYRRATGTDGGDPGDYLLLDVRGREDYAEAHIPGALCTPFGEIDRWIGRLPKDRELITYCYNYT